MKKRIYADNAATTPTDPEVLCAMLPFLSDCGGNPSSAHEDGRAPREAILRARESVAALIGADPREIVFTGSGSEADNTAIYSAAFADPARRHIVISAIEHHAVIRAAEALENFGFTVTTVPCDPKGIVTPEAVRDALRPDTALVCVMLANNEIGTIQPIGEIVRAARETGALVLTDAVQAVGNLPVDVRELGVDYLALSGHKFFAPKGIGALYVREGAPFTPLIRGGGQESGRRSGTENVPGIVGIGKAASLAREHLADMENVKRMRDRIAERLCTEGGAILNGDPEKRLPGNVSISFPGISGEGLMHLLDAEGISVSTGSACNAGSQMRSHVLLSLGLDEKRIDGTVRISITRKTSEEEADRLTETVVRLIKDIRSIE